MRVLRFCPLPTLVVAIILTFLFPPGVQAQYIIRTVAGGGPNNLAEINAGIGYPASLAFDATGNIYIADFYTNHIFAVNTGTAAITVATIVIQSGDVAIVAGNGTAGYSGDGGPATSAALHGPTGVFVDGNGNIFIADKDNSVIRKVTAATGIIATVAGTGMAGYNGDGIAATSAQLNDPFGVFVDGSGDIFIADTDNCLIREVSGGTISTVAGSAASTTPCGYAGDGELATNALLDLPEGVFVDASGYIFIADTNNNLIRVVNTGPATVMIAGVGIGAQDIQTVAGIFYDSADGTACGFANDGQLANTAQLCLPSGVFVDASENIFIADTNNYAIREVAASTSDIITTPAGTLGVEGYSANGTAANLADLNNPSNMAVDSAGDIFIADTDNFVIREVPAASGDIATTIGNNTLAYSGDGGTPLDAQLNAPGGVFVDAAGNIFVADSDNSVIREIVASTGDIQTVAGNALLGPGYTGDTGPATSAQLDTPKGVFVDSSGDIFIADTNNSVIREVRASSGTITTVAGNGMAGYTGDMGLASSAELNNPFGVFVDGAGNIFIADTSNDVIREVTASSGNISTVAGSGAECTEPSATPACGDGGPAASAQFSSPSSVFVDPSENIYVADTLDHRIRVVNTSTTSTVTVAGVTIAPGTIATVAGNGTPCTQTTEPGACGDGGAAVAGQLYDPYGVFVDLAGDIFIADTDDTEIRELAAATGLIETVAGTPQMAGFSGDGGSATSAELYTPVSVYGDSAGDIFIADTGESRIRELVAMTGISVTVTPATVNVAIGTQEQFTATVTGTTNSAVTWQVNGVAGGDAAVGTISTSGLFQAPATIPTPATVTVTAISAANSTVLGSAQATIVGAGDAVTVAVSTNPSVTEVYTSTTQVFIATVTGTSNTAVTWQVNGVTGGNSTYGTIDTSGNYTAPAAVPSPASAVIEAVSQALTSAVGTETITIVAEPAAAQPAPQTISPGSSATYSLLLNENTGNPNYPITLSCAASSLPPNATCSFSSSSGSPITTITPGPQAVPFALAISVPSGVSASLQNSMRPHFYFAFAFVPLAGILVASARRRDQRQLWLWLAALCLALILLNACGSSGGSSTMTNPELGTYNVKVQGTTKAQPNPVTITVVGLTVQ